MGLRVREMLLDDVGIRIDYFHDSSDDHLAKLGVARDRLLSRDEWRAWYAADYAKPIAERENYSLLWLLDEEVVGFSSTDNITFGEEAFMHLHILETDRRRSGLGRQFVRASAAEYFRVLQLQRLHCQPNAYNTAPNRTLQDAGFRYAFTADMAPSPINVPQPITRWTMDRPGVVAPR